MSLSNVIARFTTNPRKLFLIDGIGALISATSLGVILVRLDSIFHMPVKILYGLAVIACLLAGFSFSCYVLQIQSWRPYLKKIALVNLAYCLLTAGVVIYTYNILSIYDYGYFLVEIMIISSIVYIEYTVATTS